MRVLQVNSMLSGGGTDEQVLRLARGLVGADCTVVLAGPPQAELSAAARETGARFLPLTKGKIPFVWEIARAIRADRPDIVHAHHGRDYWPTWIAILLSGCRPKFVISRHLAKSPGSWVSRQFLLGVSDALIAVSYAVADILKRGRAQPESAVKERNWRAPMRGDLKKIHVIPCAVDTESFVRQDPFALRQTWGVKADEYVFGVVGAYNRPVGKGQLEFLRAAARIHKTCPKARFLLIGRGNMAQDLDEEILRLGLDGKAWRTPYCDDMPKAMNAIDCLVHPALGTEAFGLVVVEAMLCGTPVIASNLDGIPEAFALGGLGRLVEPESEEALAEAMLEEAREMRSGYEAEVRARIHREVSPSVVAQRHLALYESLMVVRKSN
jgi:glycosyltransferase involved in cell wall biosynthesis